MRWKRSGATGLSGAGGWLFAESFAAAQRVAAATIRCPRQSGPEDQQGCPESGCEAGWEENGQDDDRARNRGRQDGKKSVRMFEMTKLVNMQVS